MAFTQEELEAMSDDELLREYKTIEKFLNDHHKAAEDNRKEPLNRKKMIEQIQHHKSIQRMTQNKIDVGAEILKRKS